MIPPGYRTFAEHVALWQSLEDRGARREVYGRSREGRPLVCLEIGPERAPALSIAMAGIHPIEWIGVETLASWLVGAGRNPPPDRRLLVFPIVNVDGFVRVEGDLLANRRRFRRCNAAGVDLNRNFPTHFRRARFPKRLLPWVFPSGAFALSEPETRGVVGRIDRAIRAGATGLRAISLHSFGAKVLYPYGGVWKRAQDFARLHGLATKLASRVGYQAVQSSRWWPGFFAPGMELDHLYEAFGAMALLVECSHGGFTLRRPSTWLSPFVWFNPPNPKSVTEALAPAIDEFLRG
jgi:hypothetical protein